MTNKECNYVLYVFLGMTIKTPSPIELKYSWKWGLIIFLILLFLSVFFYQERIGLLDNAFQLFLIVHEGKITVMADRWPDVVHRILPFLGFKSGLSLKALMILFSISYPLVQFILYILTYRVEKQRIWSIMSLCLLTFSVSDSFYWCASELIHGLSWLMLLFALYFRKIQLGPADWLYLFFISLICIYLHPLLIFPFGFVLIYHSINKKKLSKNDLFLLLTFTILWLIKSQFFGNWYDDFKSQEFMQNLALYTHSLWNIPAHQSLVSELPSKYFVLALLFIGNGIWMMYDKKFLAFSFLLVSMLLYILVIHIGSPQATNSFYREVAYLPICIFLTFPLLLKYLESSQNPKVLLALSILFLVSVVRIYYYHTDYTDRKNWILDKTSNSECNHWLIDENKLDLQIFKMNWALPYESLILSSALNKQSSTIKSTRNNENEINTSMGKGLFLNPFNEIKAKDLNKQYFDLEASDYCKLE